MKDEKNLADNVKIISVINELLSTQLNFEKIMHGLHQYLAALTRMKWNGHYGESFAALMKSLNILKNSILHELTGMDMSGNTAGKITEFTSHLKKEISNGCTAGIRAFNDRLKRNIETGALAHQVHSFQSVIVNYEHYRTHLTKVFSKSSPTQDQHLAVPTDISSNFSPVIQRLPYMSLLIERMVETTKAPLAIDTLNTTLKMLKQKISGINEANRSEVGRRQNIHDLDRQLKTVSEHWVFFWNKSTVQKNTNLLIKRFINFLDDELRPEKKLLFTSKRNAFLEEAKELILLIQKPSPADTVKHWRDKIVIVIRQALDIIKQDLKTEYKPPQPRMPRRYHLFAESTADQNNSTASAPVPQKMSCT
jgi:hypothetical protein